MRARNFVLLLALVFAILGPAVPAQAAGWGPPTSSSRSGAMACADALFVGARGSGEAAPYGPTIEAVQRQLASRWTGTANQVFVDYPALSPHTLTSDDVEGLLLQSSPPEAAYFASVREGREALTAVLDDAQERCPAQRIVIVGFSQGAQVVTQALASRPVSPQLAGALLLGNPDHFPGQNVQELDGDVASRAMGLVATLAFLRHEAAPTVGADRGAAVYGLVKNLVELFDGTVTTQRLAAVLDDTRAVLPAAGYPRTYSVCLAGDLVCDAVPGLTRVLSGTSTLNAEFDRTRPIHGGYTPAVTERSLDAIAKAMALPVARPPAQAAPAAPAPVTAGSPAPAPGAGAGMLGAVAGAFVVGLLAGPALRRVRRSRTPSRAATSPSPGRSPAAPPPAR